MDQEELRRQLRELNPPMANWSASRGRPFFRNPRIWVRMGRWGGVSVGVPLWVALLVALVSIIVAIARHS